MGESAHLDQDLAQALWLLRRYFGHVVVLSTEPHTPARPATGGPRSDEADQANLFDGGAEADKDHAGGQLTAGVVASDRLPMS